MNMNRRAAVRRVAMMMGGALFLPNFADALDNLTPINPHFVCSADQQILIAEIAETIIPTTSTPGAKAAGVDKFIVKMLADCYEKQLSDKFMQSIQTTEAAAQAKFGKSFQGCNTEQRVELLKEVESAFIEARKKGVNHANYWGMMKELTLLGYFTSEIGCTKALRYEQIPGRYEGNAPYKKGDRAYAAGS